MKTALDTSVIVAALLAWHEDHDRSLRALQHAQKEGELLLPVDALVEAYAVLTRLPPPHRISPDVAHRILRESFRATATLCVLRRRSVWTLLKRLASANISGGRTYDARILATARSAHADRLLTLDARDFGALDAGETVVIVPGAR